MSDTAKKTMHSDWEMGKLSPVDADQYKGCRVVGYIGGGFDGGLLVVCCGEAGKFD